MKKALSVLLSLMMMLSVLTALPFNAFAEDTRTKVTSLKAEEIEVEMPKLGDSVNNPTFTVVNPPVSVTSDAVWQKKTSSGWASAGSTFTEGTYRIYLSVSMDSDTHVFASTVTITIGDDDEGAQFTLSAQAGNASTIYFTSDEVEVHELEVVEAVYPTCTEKGNSEYYKCKNCGKCFKDEYATKPTTAEDEKTGPRGHNMTYYPKSSPNCSSKGRKAYYMCSSCEKYFEDEDGTVEITDLSALDIAPTGKHDFGKNLAACIYCGTTNPDYKGVPMPVNNNTEDDNGNKPAPVKVANTLKVKAKTVKLKFAKLKKKKLSVKRSRAISVKGAKGTVTYLKLKGKKKIKVNRTNGKITVKKGLKKGTYKVKIRVTASGNAQYNPKTKTVTVKIVVE